MFDDKLKKLIGLGYRTVLLSKEFAETRNENKQNPIEPSPGEQITR